MTAVWALLPNRENEILRSVHANSQEQLQSCVFENLKDVIVLSECKWNKMAYFIFTLM